MRLTDNEYGRFDIYLEDDGTMDTVVSVCPVDIPNESDEIRFSTEYASYFRTDAGFEELAYEALETYIEQNLV